MARKGKITLKEVKETVKTKKETASGKVDDIQEVKKSADTLSFAELKILVQKKELFLSDLKIKTYLPLLDKSVAIKRVCESCIVYDEQGIAYVDSIQKKISTMLTVLLNYCSLSADGVVEETIDVLDTLLESGYYRQIEETIGNDLHDFYYMIEAELANMLERNNSVEGILAKGINALVQKMPNTKEVQKIVKSGFKELKNFDPEKLTMMQNMLKTIQPENK